jgi:hypothetical protein
LSACKARAQPYRQFGTNKVVLRAELTLSLVNFVNGHLFTGWPINSTAPTDLGDILNVSLGVDLFEKPEYVKHAIDAVRLHDDEG